MEINHPTPNQLPGIITLLNKEFIFSKKLTLPLEERFPDLINEKNLQNLFGIFHDDQIISFAAVKPVRISTPERIIRAFFVGLVFSAINYRGKGHSLELIKFIQEHYKAKGKEIGFLWTNINHFYEKTGWVNYDNGLLFTCLPTMAEVSGSRILKIEEFEDSMIPQVDMFRKKQLESYIERTNDNITYSGYKTVYPPCEKMFRLVCIEGEDEILGYLLGALIHKECFIYELITIDNSDEMKLELLKHIITEFSIKTIKINLFKNDLFQEKIKESFNEVIFHKTNIQMIFCQDIQIKQIAKDIYVPFADRI
jgi:predicted acetyltransferase